MSNDYEKAIDTLMKDVRDLRADMKSILCALYGKAKDYLDDAKESVHESVAERVDQVRDAASAVGRSCRRTSKGYAAEIGEHPFASVLVALGVGAALGGLMRWRQR